MSDRESLRAALARRVLVADGAMGTMLQGFDPSLADFEGYEGCNEVLNVTRPDVVAGVHDAYLAAGADVVETNTFGANWAALGEYEISERIGELSLAGARIARERADHWSEETGRRRFVLGSMGPGTKLPSLGHVAFSVLREGYRQNAEGLIEGGADGLIVETCQDLLQAKAAVLGAKDAIEASGRDVVLVVQVTIETNGAMLLGSEIGAALGVIEPLGADVIGLNCATGPAEMSEHLRYLARHCSVGLSCMPNAGLPELTADGARYPLSAEELAAAQVGFVEQFGVGLVGGCCGTTPEHITAVAEAVAGRQAKARRVVSVPGAASLYAHVPFSQDASYLAIGERTNANGSRVFREAMLAGRWEECVEIARAQVREGAHLLDVCVDYVGRDGVADMRELAFRLATASTLPLMLDSTEPAVLAAGLEMLGGRAVVNSVNFEDGDGPESRFSKIMHLVREHGAAVVALTIDEQGQARDADWKVRVAERLIAQLTGDWGMNVGDILIDCLTFPIATGQEETRRDAVATIEAIGRIKTAYPGVRTTLGVSNVSFGLNPAARVVLNSVFLHECVKAGLDSAIVSPAKIVPVAQIPEEQRQVALDLVYDRRREGYDPLARFMELFEGVDVAQLRAGRAARLAGLGLWERLQARIVEGERKGLEEDLDEALALRPALEIINEVLLEGMKTVGELFGSGQMQLPFVLASAEVMKAAVGYLQPHMPKVVDGNGSKGRIVLATVKGDVHDIGKNLVDIILSNNGFDVVNLGIKQPVSAILEAAQEHQADVIGMSGLLVKSTVIMRENLEEITSRGLADQFPVLLGGAALTRSYVEQDLARMFPGQVRYARDAFEGLRLMEGLVAVKRGAAPEQVLPPLRARRVATGATLTRTEPEAMPARSDVAVDVPVPGAPFYGSRVVKGIALAEYAAFLDERATFMGQWGLKPSRGKDGPGYEDLVEAEGRPRLRMWLDRLHTDNLLQAAVVYGYYPCQSDGDDLIILDPGTVDPALLPAPGRRALVGAGVGTAALGTGAAPLAEPRPDRAGPAGRELVRFSFPRQRRDRHLCLADFFRPVTSGEVDVVSFQVVTMGHKIAQATAELFAKDAYRDYLELHGLSVQLTEALAEYWHARVRAELGIGGDETLADMLKVNITGCRYSFGYPACPDLEDQAQLFTLLDPARIGVELSPEYQLHPEQSTSALVTHHPEAKYFNV